MNAQLRLGVYPPGWVVDEISWRIYSFCVACAPVGVGAVPGVPVAVPAVGMAPGVAAGAGVPNLPPSPVAMGVDATEKGQLGYHLGTAIGGALIEYLAGAGGGSLLYPFHLSRAEANGGQFVLGPQRPDIVIFDVHPGTLVVSNFVVWENKGHAAGPAGAAPLLAALAQAQSLANMTHWPGNPHIGGGVAGGALIGGGGIAPDAHLASMVDSYHGNYRVQVIDPPGKGRVPPPMSPQEGDNFFTGYYAPFAEAVQSGSSPQRRQYGGRPFRTVGLEKEVRLGLDEEILSALSSRGSGRVSSRIAQALSKGYPFKADDSLYVHPTGISVELPKGWKPNRNPVGGKGTFMREVPLDEETAARVPVRRTGRQTSR
ncbi:hypothetical protein [Corallococcus sp. AB049A]|uniref:hypothetical protein n=1 Tax=Corallococcus sp. AB049A TaxID=2316721 RepID=UPI0011C458B8|nr:hypothetical protein [Corallococcus sp. AB049A]